MTTFIIIVPLLKMALFGNLASNPDEQGFRCASASSKKDFRLSIRSGSRMTPSIRQRRTPPDLKREVAAVRIRHSFYLLKQLPDFRKSVKAFTGFENNELPISCIGGISNFFCNPLLLCPYKCA
jgi:hypothetical protein